MLKLLKKNTLFLTLALAMIALCAMGTNAEAADVKFDISDASTDAGGNLSIHGNGATEGGWLVAIGDRGGKNDGGNLNWAARTIAPSGGGTRQVRIQLGGNHRLQIDTNNPAGAGVGSFTIADFDGTVVSNFMQAEMGQTNGNAFTYQALVRQTITNKWYVSREVSNSGGTVITFKSADAEWAEVTNAEAIGMNAAATGTATFTTDAFIIAGSTIALSSVNIDRGGIYVSQEHISADAYFNTINFLEAISGPTALVPEVRGMNQAQATQAFVDAGFTGVPTFSTATSTWSDAFPLGTVFTMSENAGSIQSAAAVIALELIGGSAPYWKWTKGADGNSDLAGNWTASGDIAFGGNALTPPAGGSTADRVAFAAPHTITIPAGTTFNSNFTPCRGGVTIILEGTITGESGFALGAQQAFYGSGLNDSKATMVIQGTGVFSKRNMQIGQANGYMAGEASLTVKGTGTIDTSRQIEIGDPDVGAGASTSSLTLIGSAVTCSAGRAFQLKSPNATLKIVADAAGFPTIGVADARTNNGDRMELTAGTIEIDATAFTAAVKGTTYTLISGAGVAGVVNADILLNAVITPPTGGDAAEWSLLHIDTDADGDLDGLGLRYIEVLPAELVVSATEITMSEIVLPKGDTASSATVTVTNGGDKTLDITGITLVGDLGFALVSPSTTTLPITLRSTATFGDFQEIVVSFDTGLLSNPSTAGTYTATLTVDSDAPGGAPAAISLSVEVLAGLRPAAIKEENWILY